MTEPAFTSRLALLPGKDFAHSLKTVFLVPAKEANLILIFLFPYAFQSSLRVCISHVLTSGARLLAFCTAGRDSNFLQCWQSVSETASLSQNP